MDIHTPCVVALSWRLQDTLGDTLDETEEPVEFFVGGDDLLPRVQEALQGHAKGAELHLHLEPEEAFGDYDEELVQLVPRASLPAGIEEGMTIEGIALPASIDASVPREGLYTITEIYPEHVVLDANHPLAGIALRLHLRVANVREATEAEVGHGSTGTGFFTVAPTAPGSSQLH
ncbi:peptidylprolyl isomerase [Comamonas serinivorans]|uniref:Peptidyl-prolyl cis-trans isomerase n=1 Tax=Comamonas serinivorans TaxID=1082851 RepID=A0A1Y0EQC6_9BURK|nr:FKBP-type peptidyl-prolyl cis-trans isomerase [Comamonas serinivorans]ARU05509.1 peptidylprolyl isomerase [Comamonas serinivorans]